MRKFVKNSDISFINADTEVRVLEQVKLLMTETEQERPEFLDAVIEAAVAARGPAYPCYALQRTIIHINYI